MRRKLLALICTLALCFGCFAIAGCGNSKPEDEGTTVTDVEQEPEEKVEEKVDPAEKFYGEWKSALVESQGVKMVGDLSAMLDTESGIVLKVNDDNTGSLTLGDEGGDFTWKLKDDDTLTITIQDEDGEENMTTNLAYTNDALVLDLKGASFEGRFTFTKDGTIEGYDLVDESSLTNITAADQLLGSWSLTGFSMQGMTVYGDAETISTIAGTDEMVISFEDDGACSLNGSTITWGIDEESGAHLENDSQSVAIKLAGDYLVMDMSEVTDMDAYALFSKTE